MAWEHRPAIRNANILIDNNNNNIQTSRNYLLKLRQIASNDSARGLRRWQVRTKHKFLQLARTADTTSVRGAVHPLSHQNQYFKEPDAVQTATFTPVLLTKHSSLYLYTWNCINWILVTQQCHAIGTSAWAACDIGQWCNTTDRSGVLKQKSDIWFVNKEYDYRLNRKTRCPVTN